MEAHRPASLQHAERFRGDPVAVLVGHHRQAGTENLGCAAAPDGQVRDVANDETAGSCPTHWVEPGLHKVVDVDRVGFLTLTGEVQDELRPGSIRGKLDHASAPRQDGHGRSTCAVEATGRGSAGRKSCCRQTLTTPYDSKRGPPLSGPDGGRTGSRTSATGRSAM